jgi:hypothetical protein
VKNAQGVITMFACSLLLSLTSNADIKDEFEKQINDIDQTVRRKIQRYQTYDPRLIGVIGVSTLTLGRGVQTFNKVKPLRGLLITALGASSLFFAEEIVDTYDKITK